VDLQPRRAETAKPVCGRYYEEFDIAEMSMSWYMMARCRKEPVIALPIFPLRMQIHPYIFCSASSGIEQPGDLKGKKIGMDEYRLTVGLWARGILQEHYGVPSGRLPLVHFRTRESRLSTAREHRNHRC
jgi:hypothetical protein